MTITQISGTVFADDAPGYGVVRLPQTCTMLLDADAPSWHDAIAIEWGPHPYRTRFRACWDPIALHVRFDALDNAPWHTMTTRDVLTGEHGPRPAPFTLQPREATASLVKLEAVEATWVLPGHGPPWDRGVTDALRQFRLVVAGR